MMAMKTGTKMTALKVDLKVRKNSLSDSKELYYMDLTLHFISLVN